MNFTKITPYVFLCILFIFGIYYVNLSARDLIFMDYWRMVSKLIPNLTEGELTFSSIWVAELGHRNPLAYLILAFDIKFLNINCLWESYSGILVILFSALLVINKWKQVLKTLQIENHRCVWLLIVFTFLPLFNLNQWEILSLQCSFVFMLRICLYILIFSLLDNIIVRSRYSLSKCFLFGIGVGFIVCFLSQLYWCSLLVAVFLCFGLYFCISTNETSILQKFKFSVSFFTPIIFAALYYLYDIPKIGSDNDIKNFFSLLISGDIFYAVAYSLDAIFLPQTVVQSLPLVGVSIIGFFIGLFILGSLILFFTTKIYKITYFPLVLLLYGLISIGVLIYGRSGMFNIEYLSTSRYVCETTLIAVGSIFIYITSIAKIVNDGNLLLRKVAVSSLFLSCVLFTSLLIYSYKYEFNIAPYRGYYKDNLINYLNDLSVVSDTFDLDPKVVSLLQTDKTSVRKTLWYIKKYDYKLYFNNMPKPGNSLDTASSKKGFWDDGWISPESSLKISTTSSGKLYISFYDPFWNEHQDGEVILYQNGVLLKSFRTAENISDVLDVNKNDVIHLSIKTTFSKTPLPPDERSLGVLVNRLECL